jgi:hypothetical protein
MGRIGIERPYVSSDGYIMSRNPHMVRAIAQHRTKRACHLITDQQHAGAFMWQIMQQMMADPSTLAHARSGDDDNAGHTVDLLRFLNIVREVDVRHRQQIVSAMTMSLSCARDTFG